MSQASALKPGVLHLIGSFEQGGSERQALQLAGSLLASSRFGVHVACLRRQGSLLSTAESMFGPVAEFPLGSFYDANALRQVRRMARLLRSESIQILQTHDFYTNVFGLAAGALARVPVRIGARRETGGVRTRQQKVAERLAYQMAHVIVANAEAVGEQLVREGIPASKIATVYNGLDMNRVMPSGESRESILRQFGIPPHSRSRFVTIVANMHFPVKGHPVFLRAAQIASRSVPDAMFLLAGEGELVERMKALAKDLGLADRAFFLGRCDQVGDLLNISDIGVLSSTSEGFPNAVIEYMAAGKPVVSTDVGGVREAVVEGETGFLVPIGNAELLAERIVTLLQHPDRAQEMGTAGRRVVEDRFSCEAQLAATEALYAQLLRAAPISDRHQPAVRLQ